MSDGLRDGLEPLIPAYLGRQRWYRRAAPPARMSVRVERGQVLWASGDGPPAVARHRRGRRDALPAPHRRAAGRRNAPTSCTAARRRSSVRSTATVFYDAVLDPELARALLEVASGGAETATLARPMSAEQSNTSLVFDDRLILKLFRRLHDGRNPDVEVTIRAGRAPGSSTWPRPLVTWREEPYDLAFGQQYLAGGSEGWALALTSLRDFYNSSCDHPAEAGGDFAARPAGWGG